MLKRPIAYVSSLIGGLFLAASAQATTFQNAWNFHFPMLDGSELPLSRYQGNVLLVVNTASQCGFTPQYRDLQTLYERYRDQGLVVLAVPSNDFGQQEPGSSEDIAQFTQKEYQVHFPVTARQVVSGGEAHPFYRWANQQAGVFGSPKWNFHKYLIGRDGQLKDWFATTTKPLDAVVTKAIEAALATEAPALSTPTAPPQP